MQGRHFFFPPTKVTDNDAVAKGGKNIQDHQIYSFAFDFQYLAAFYDENL